MNKINFLGAAGSRAADNQTTSIQLSSSVFIDAGSLSVLGDDVLDIEHIFLTHSHLDHILDLGFIMDYGFDRRSKPVKVYGLPATLESVKLHLLNNILWPDFTQINLLQTNQPSMEFIPLELDKTYFPTSKVSLTPFATVHSLPTCGFLIEKADDATIFAADSFKNPKVWEMANTNPKVKSIIVDVSFPNGLGDLAERTLHLTPEILQQEITQLKRDDIKVFAFHLKPFTRRETMQDLAKIGLDASQVVEDGDCIDLTRAAKCHNNYLTLTERIKNLNEIGIALSAEADLDVLLEKIVEQAKSLTGADGGTFYLLEEGELHFTVAQTDSLGVKMGGTGDAITWPPLPTVLEDGSLNKEAVAAVCALEGRAINIDDIYQETEFSFEGAKEFDKANNYRSKSMLVIPLKNFEDKVIGVLQLLNKSNPNRVILSFNQDDVEITKSLASQAAVALTNVQLIEDLEDLLESFLSSIIYLMGKKSPYTEDHINRMVDLSEMLAHEINKKPEVFQRGKFSSNQLQAIRLAALMHDIGKLATPEVVMDKATKLDGHFDKIHLVRERAKWLKAEAEKYALEQELKLRSQGDLRRAEVAKIHQEKDQILNRIQEGLELVENSNLGAEFFAEDKILAIEDLAARPFKIGGISESLISREDAYALSVQRGTLTFEEREVINDHAQIGIDVLETLPFPEKYKDIPHIAGAHHEKINGKGYPLGLAGDEISFEARILAIADVFEAITSSDRPYKKPNSLSTAMKILYFMAKDNELDRDIVKFFYESGLYKQYAAKYLKEDLIDEVTLDFNFD